jgi:hypothetical protein
LVIYINDIDLFTAAVAAEYPGIGHQPARPEWRAQTGKVDAIAAGAFFDAAE